MKASHASIVMVAVVLGAALGLGAYTFAYARGWSYMTDDPRACANCHVMNEQYDGWTKSSHRSVAVCNDCHVPHDVRRPSMRRRPATASGTRTTSQPARSPSPSERCRGAGPSPRRIAAAATSRSSRRWGRPHTPDRATSRVSVATDPSATWNLPRPTSRSLRGEPCPTRNEAEFAAGVAGLS